MKLKLTIDRNWKQRYKKQSEEIIKWIDNGASLDEKEKPDLFDKYLRGTDIAGIGQGRFSNNAKAKVKDAWVGQVLNLLKAVKNASENELFNKCENLQKKLIEFCKKTKKKGEEDVEIDEHKPWAAIHAMIVALQPKVFCTIVSEGNLDELFKKLSEVADDNDSEDGPKDGPKDQDTIYLKFGIEWETLNNEWKEAKKQVKDNMSWYYKSAAINKYFNSIVSQNDSAWIYSNYPWATLEALRGEKKIEMLKDKLIKQKNIILTGAPGTGKTYLAKKVASLLITGNSDFENLNGDMETQFKQQYGFTQFHPSYDYTDFVEGLRPTRVKESCKTENNKDVIFERMDGIFKAFCAKAKQDTTEGHNYVFVIDEINRGEISKIFGELFFAIDPGYRGEKGLIKTQYQNMIDSGDFEDGFYIPNNVYVIGTMNDIDRSVESMDFAFRRRFGFIEVSASDSESIIYSELNEDIDKQEAVDRMRAINKVLMEKCGLSPQYQIGGAYFLKLNDVLSKASDAKFKELWQDYLQGTLYEYFRGLPANEIDEKMKVLKEAYENGVDDE